MIKKLLLSLMVVLGLSTTTLAADHYTHDVNVLPKAAQTILANNFKSEISVIKVDKDFGRISEYEVILNNGTEISFDRNGNWKNIEVSKNGTIPSKFIPSPISNYVKTNQSGAKIVGIDKERSGYEVELSNGVEMKFNKEGKFIRYDK